jgi:hypothetical protein
MINGIHPHAIPLPVWAPPETGRWSDDQLRAAADALADGKSWQAAARAAHRTYDALRVKISYAGGVEAFIEKHRSAV